MSRNAGAGTSAGPLVLERESTPSDNALVERLRAGDTEAMSTVATRHRSAVRAAANRIVDAHAADDVAQDVLLRLWLRPSRFDPSRGSLRAFLVKDATGRALDRLRSDGARSRRERRDRPVEERAQPDDLLLARCQSDTVRAALLAIPKAERVAILLAFYGSLPYRTVAIVLCVPEGTTKTRIRSGLRRLATTLVDPKAVAV